MYSLALSGGRHVDAESLRGLEIDHQLEPGRRLHRQVARFLTPEDAVDIRCRLPGLLDLIDAVFSGPCLRHLRG